MAPLALRFLPLLALAGLPSVATGQLEYGGAPPSAFAALSGDVPTVTMRPVDVTELLSEDARAGKGPYRFGENLEVDLGFEDGAWTELGNGARVWRLRVSSPGAFSLSFVFAQYDLPPGAELYAYDDQRSTVYGQFNDLNENPEGGMAIRPLAGDAVTLEYLEPAGVEHPGALRIATVVHDYRDVLALLEEESAEGACEVDVACPQGAPWQLQARAVTRLLIGGTLCTGSLVNNTAVDGTQLYLSANHCGSLTNAIFYFKYQKSGCGAGSAPSTFTVQGSTLLATSSTLDYRLVRINPLIPASYAPYYAGWDRTGVAPPSTATIHHPGGDPKKISLDNNPPAKSGTQWRILQWDLGVTEGGSSGCPLYSSAGRYIGQLCCGAAFCGFPFDDFYGRLDAQWSQIASFLDPLGTGATTLDGFDPSGGGPTGPDITGFLPPSVSALIPGSAQTVSILGSGFSASTTVTVDGVALFGIPSPYTVVSSNQITLNMPQVDNLGAVNVQVADVSGSDTAPITVTAPALPQLQAGTGDQPVTALTVAGLDVTLSSLPNDLFLLFWSPSGLPSTMAGVVSLEIGNAFSQLFSAGNFTVNPTQAWNKIHVSLAGVPPVTTFFIEGVVVRATGLVFPLATSNRQECLVLF
jgi:hypothetical protein